MQAQVHVNILYLHVKSHKHKVNIHKFSKRPLSCVSQHRKKAGGSRVVLVSFGRVLPVLIEAK